MDDVVKSLLDRQPLKSAPTKPAAPSAGASKPQRPSREEAEAAVRTLLLWTGDDPNREGLLDTPQRVVKAYEEFFAGYRDDASDVLARVFEEVQGYDDLVLVRDISFSSHCEHHMVPFVGKAHIAYYPERAGRRRPVEARPARRYLRQAPADAGGADRADHRRDRAVSASARLRGDDRSRAYVHVDARRPKQGATTITNQFTGVFRDDPAEQVRFLTLLRNK